MSAVTIASDFKSAPRGALLGFFTLTLPSGLVLHSCSLFGKDGKALAAVQAITGGRSAP